MKIRIKTRQEILNSQLFLDVPYTITTNLTFWEVWTGWDQTFSTVSCSSNSYIQSLYTWLFENSEQDETKNMQKSVASQMAIPTETNCWEFLSVRCSSNYWTNYFKNGLLHKLLQERTLDFCFNRKRQGISDSALHLGLHTHTHTYTHTHTHTRTLLLCTIPIRTDSWVNFSSSYNTYYLRKLTVENFFQSGAPHITTHNNILCIHILYRYYVCVFVCVCDNMRSTRLPIEPTYYVYYV